MLRHVQTGCDMFTEDMGRDNDASHIPVDEVIVKLKHSELTELQDCASYENSLVQFML